jgi:hypothetical protein
MQTFPPHGTMRSLMSQLGIELMHRGLTIMPTVEQMRDCMDYTSKLSFVRVDNSTSVTSMQAMTYVLVDLSNRRALLCPYTPRIPFKMPINLHPRELTANERHLFSLCDGIEAGVQACDCAGCGMRIKEEIDNVDRCRCPHCNMMFCSSRCYLKQIREHVKGNGCTMNQSMVAQYFVGVRCIGSEPMPLVPSPIALLLTSYVVRSLAREWGTEYYFVDPTTLRHFVVLTTNMNTALATNLLAYNRNFSHPTRIEMDFLETVNFSIMNLELTGLTRAAQKRVIWVYRAKNFEHIRPYKLRQALGTWVASIKASRSSERRRALHDKQIMVYFFNKLCGKLRVAIQQRGDRKRKSRFCHLSIALMSFRRHVQYSQAAKSTTIVISVPAHKYDLAMWFDIFANKCAIGQYFKRKALYTQKRAADFNVLQAFHKAWEAFRTQCILAKYMLEIAASSALHYVTKLRRVQLSSGFNALVANFVGHQKTIVALSKASVICNKKNMHRYITFWKKTAVRRLRRNEKRLQRQMTTLREEHDNALSQIKAQAARHAEETLKAWNVVAQAQLEVDAYKRRMHACKQYYMKCLKDAQTSMTCMFDDRMNTAEKM